MGKYLTGILMVLAICSRAYCADQGGNTLSAYSGTKLMYPYYDYWAGAHVKLTGDDVMHPTNTPEITKLLESTQKGRDFLGSYYFKNTAGIAIYSAAVACGAWLCVDAGIYQVDNDTRGFPPTFKDAVLLTVFVAGVFGGAILQNDGVNDLFKSINEYNLSISCPEKGGAVINTDIKF